jgi:ABC-2 type transport system ATP-binding protein
VEVLKLENVNKTFGEINAVRDLTFSIKERSVFGLLGPNGAGKTTTIRMIMEIILPDSGRIEIFGKPNSQYLRDQVGYLPEERGLYKKMKVMDVLLFFSDIKNVKRSVAQEKGEMWLQRLDLLEWSGKKVEELSRGMQQKLQFITTILHEPKLIILDEPFTGLDPINTNLLKEIMVEFKEKGATIIFSTHLMEQVEKLCDSICVIDKGQKVIGGGLGEVKAKYGKNHIRMNYRGKADFLNDSSLVDGFDDYGQYVEVRPAQGVEPQQILAAAIKQVSINKFEITEPSLNEIFIDVVKKVREDTR